jgi:hypothetical protein
MRERGPGDSFVRRGERTLRGPARGTPSTEGIRGASIGPGLRGGGVRRCPRTAPLRSEPEPTWSNGGKDTSGVGAQLFRFDSPGREDSCPLGEHGIGRVGGLRRGLQALRDSDGPRSVAGVCPFCAREAPRWPHETQQEPMGPVRLSRGILSTACSCATSRSGLEIHRVARPLGVRIPRPPPPNPSRAGALPEMSSDVDSGAHRLISRLRMAGLPQHTRRPRLETRGGGTCPPELGHCLAVSPSPGRLLHPKCPGRPHPDRWSRPPSYGRQG